MKTDRFIYRLKSVATLAALLLLAACSADEPVASTPSEEEFEGIVLNIPNLKTSTTRANEYDPIEGEEGTISSLYIVAYPQTEDSNGKKGETLVRDVTSELSKLSDENYTAVKVRMPADKYHIYVLANVSLSNLELYNPTAKDSEALTGSSLVEALEAISENNLENLHIVNLNPTGSGAAIPMSCNAKSVKTGSSSATATIPANNNVVIEKRKTTRVYATLFFAMAKVRYTIVNGKAKFLTMADEMVKFFNYTDRVGAVEHIHSLNTAGIALKDSIALNTGGAYYKYPTVTETDNATNTSKEVPVTYDDKTGLTLDCDFFTNNKDKITAYASDEALKKEWIYKGVAYVPERLFNKEDWEDKDYPKTEIRFNFLNSANNNLPLYNYSNRTRTALGGKEEIEDPLVPGSSANGKHFGVVRGIIYDMLIFTTEKDIAFQVRVRSWKYQDYQFDL